LVVGEADSFAALRNDNQKGKRKGNGAALVDLGHPHPTHER
jgi:hypothetical protein